MQGVDEQDTEHHKLMVEADDLEGMPVVVADLHSALPAGTDRDARHRSRPEGRLRHDDRRRAPGLLSRTLDALAASLVGVVTVGQAWGGDLEAVTLHTGLLAARHVLRADLAVVTQGPGNLGTGTPWGSGVAAGEA